LLEVGLVICSITLLTGGICFGLVGVRWGVGVVTALTELVFCTDARASLWGTGHPCRFFVDATHVAMIWFRTMALTYGVPARHSIAFRSRTYSQGASTSSPFGAHEMRKRFGPNENGAVILNVVGRIASDCWREFRSIWAC